MTKMRGIWSDHARNWSSVGQPQRPSTEDIALFFSQARPLLMALPVSLRRAGILGVTPELVQGPWPIDTLVDAYDRSQDMIDQIWAPHPTSQSVVHCAEWHCLPVEDAAFGVIVGDGSPNQCPDATYYALFFQEVRRVLRHDGAFVSRYFLRPERQEPLEQIAAHVRAGQVKSFGALKWRIAMALTDPTTMAVKLRDIAQAFDQMFPDRRALLSHTGWSVEEMQTIEKYRDKQECYSFPSLSELREMVSPYFSISALDQGSYELAPCCPVITLRPR